MAPPPPASLPLQDRLLQLAQTLQFAWFAGHVWLLFATLFYGISYVTFSTKSTWAEFNYRSAFIGAAVTYGIVVYKNQRARAKSAASQAKAGQSAPAQQGALAMLADENVQYLLMAFVWLFYYQVALAILPFAVYSVFHVATYVRSNLLPTLYPAAPTSSSSKSPSSTPSKTGASSTTPTTTSPLADTLYTFVKSYYDTSMTLVAGLEIALWFRVFFGALSFSRGSWILLVIYTVFFRSRYSQSSFVQGALHEFGGRVDGVVAHQQTPPQVRSGWHAAKGVLAQARDATDLRRYVGASGASVPKKAS